MFWSAGESTGLFGRSLNQLVNQVPRPIEANCTPFDDSRVWNPLSKLKNGVAARRSNDCVVVIGAVDRDAVVSVMGQRT
jgi:hypothetical protein